jgi:hypothetical protein
VFKNGYISFFVFYYERETAWFGKNLNLKPLITKPYFMQSYQCHRTYLETDETIKDQKSVTFVMKPTSWGHQRLSFLDVQRDEQHKYIKEANLGQAKNVVAFPDQISVLPKSNSFPHKRSLHFVYLTQLSYFVERLTPDSLISFKC